MRRILRIAEMTSHSLNFSFFETDMRRHLSQVRVGTCMMHKLEPLSSLVVDLVAKLVKGPVKTIG